MPIGDIQLNTAAMPADRPPMALTKEQRQYRSREPLARTGVVIGEQPTDTTGKTPEELDNTALSRVHVEQFLLEVQHQPHWRREADRACDFYDGNQLSTEDVETLIERGQPPLITNIIKPTIDTVLGMEAKSRSDWRVRPEDNEECPDDLAEGLSVKLKHAEIESRADRAVSDAYAAEIKAGLGWVEVSREHDPFKCPYRVRYVHRREIHWDWRAEQPDLSDARYLIRRRWLEMDHAIALMPQYATLLRMAACGWSGFDPVIEQDTRLVQSWEGERDTRIAANDWRDTQRERLCLSEIWYRKWVRGYVMTLPNGTSIEVDFDNPRHNEAIMSGIAKVKQATFQKVRLAWYCGPHFLYDVPSPYKHNQFPYVPFFGYREDLTNAPYGVIRSMLSPQVEINARKSKMLWALNSRRVEADSDAVKDHRLAALEVARPDAYIILDANRKPSSKFTVSPGGELATQQFQVMQEAKQEIAEASGIHKSMQGQQTGAASGLAINSLIEQGMNTLAEINDNFRYARRLVGEMLFELVKQNLMQGQSKVSVGEGKRKKTIVFNQPSVDEQTGQPVMLNDVARVKASIVLDDVPSTPTYKMQQMQMLTEITKSLPPQLQGYIIDFVIEATDYPKRHELADRLRAASGIQDQDQQEAQAQAQQAAQAEQLRMATAEQMAKIEGMHATAQKTLAEAKNLVLNSENGGSMAAMQSKFHEQIRVLQDQAALLQQQLDDKQTDINLKYSTELEKTRITANAAVQTAQIQQAGAEMLEPIVEMVRATQQEIEKLRLDESTQLKLIQKDIEQVIKTSAKPSPEPVPKTEPENPVLAQVLATMAQTQVALAQILASPRQTKIIEDKEGRAVGSVSSIQND